MLRRRVLRWSVSRGARWTRFAAGLARKVIRTLIQVGSSERAPSRPQIADLRLARGGEPARRLAILAYRRFGPAGTQSQDLAGTPDAAAGAVRRIDDEVRLVDAVPVDVRVRRHDDDDVRTGDQPVERDAL